MGCSHGSAQSGGRWSTAATAQREESSMTVHGFTRREALGAAGALAGISLTTAVGCGRRAAGAGDDASGLTGFALIRAELARLLETDRLPMEAGYRTLEDGMVMIAAIHHIPNVKGAMIEWWLKRRKTDEEFRMWHPKEHVHWEWDEKLKAEIAHHLIDGEIQKGKKCSQTHILIAVLAKSAHCAQRCIVCLSRISSTGLMIAHRER